MPEMNTGHRLQNKYLTVLWFLEIAASINSSFNIFVYYSMGSTYRETMKELFCKSRRITAKSANRDMGDRQTMNKMELPMSIFVSATSREDSVPDDLSDLQAAAFRSLRVVTRVVTVTTAITPPGRPSPYTTESNKVMNSWIIRNRSDGQSGTVLLNSGRNNHPNHRPEVIYRV